VVDIQSIVNSQPSREEVEIRCCNNSCSSDLGTCEWNYDRCPDVLILHLNRWSDRCSARNQLAISPSPVLRMMEKNHDVTYRLQSFVLYDGTASSGHYTTSVLCGRQWVSCNDSRVINVKAADATSATDKLFLCLYSKQVPVNQEEHSFTNFSMILQRQPPKKRFASSYLNQRALWG
jgi:hypothetical protein